MLDICVFSFTAIKSIKILSSVKLIKKCAFKSYKQLKTIEIQKDSKLQAIDKWAFSKTAINCISFPSSVTYIGEGAFDFCGQLLIIEINNSKLTHMLQDAFKYCKNALIMVEVHS